jgi:transcriptional regulator with XRE-family HTH domain
MRPNRKTTAKKLDPSASTRAMYGAELRYQRMKANLSQVELAELVYVTASFIANLEAGRRRIQLELAELLDRVLDSDGFFVRNLEAARATPHREDFADVAELETVALTVRNWDPMLVPGVLQTPDYALAVIRAYDPVLPEPEVMARHKARTDRAVLLDDPGTPMYWATVSEAAIRCPVGGSAVMAEQLRHIAAMVRRNRILFQVIPLSAGPHPGMGGGLTLMTFENDAPVAYRSGVATGSLTDDPATVRRASLTYDLLGMSALSQDASLTLIEAVAEEYEHGQQGQQGQPDGGDVA